jgi:DNA phosphorothioation-dependent restriction protein DptG
MLKSLPSKSIGTISDFDCNNFNIFIACYGLLFMPQYVLKNNNYEPEDDLNRSKHVVLYNKWNVVVWTHLVLDF